MKRKKNITLRSILIFFLGCTLLAVKVQGVQRQDTGGEKTELIFVLDVSRSMEKADREKRISDLVRQMDLSLPCNYRTGFVSYNSGVVKSQGLGQAGEVAAGFNRISYSGYSNTRAGLSQAMEMFSGEQSGIRKKILLITDGEIDLPAKAETEAAKEAVKEAFGKAQAQGISVDILLLDQLFAPAKSQAENAVESAAAAAGGEVHAVREESGVSSFAMTYLFEECQVPAVMAGRISGQEAELPIVLPDQGMDQAKILLFGTPPGAQVNVSGKAGRMQVEQGTGFTAVILDKPQQESYTLQMTGRPGMEVFVYLSAEYRLSLTEEHHYQAETGKVTFDLELLGGDGGSLLGGHLSGQEIRVLLDGKQQKAEYANGHLRVSKEMEKSGPVRIQLLLPPGYAHYEGLTETIAEVEIPQAEPDYFLIAAGGILAVSLLLLVVWAGKKRRRYPPVRRGGKEEYGDSGAEEKEAYGSEFQGKVTVYVVNSEDGIDHQPETINLSSKCTKDIISLQWILDACGLPLVLRDADRIIFRPGEGRSLLLKNSSRATALKGREVLAKFHSYPIYFKQKATFLFEHGLEAGAEPTEIEIHYKELNIKER